jgi:hypothetical protein
VRVLSEFCKVGPVNYELYFPQTAIAKEEFNRKISLFISKLNIKLSKKLIWSIALYGSETWTLRKLELKYLESWKYGMEIIICKSQIMRVCKRNKPLRS